MGLKQNWSKGGQPPTLEAWRREPVHAPKAPSGGSRLTERVESDDWISRSKCAADPNVGPSFFHPPEGFQRFHDIRRYCSDCPVAAECEKWAVESATWVGWYGGKSPRERGGDMRRIVAPRLRQHGQYETYKYGLSGTDATQGCRCEPCVMKARETVRRYHRERRAGYR